MPDAINRAGNRRLPELEYLGDALLFTAQLHAMLPYSPLFESLQLDEVHALSPFLEVYRAQSGQTVLREGEAGDFMLFVIEGRIDVFIFLQRDRTEGDQGMRMIKASSQKT